MSIALPLKKRKNGKTIVIPLGLRERLLREGQTEEQIKDLIYKSLLEAEKANEVHDLHWLRSLTEWASSDGTPTKHAGKWLYMAVKFNEMEDDATEVVLSPTQVDTLWSRISGDEGFKFFNGIPPAWAAFILDFQRATGKHFESEDPDAFSTAPRAD